VMGRDSEPSSSHSNQNQSSSSPQSQESRPSPNLPPRPSALRSSRWLSPPSAGLHGFYI
jgi:hypothetical protein